MGGSPNLSDTGRRSFARSGQVYRLVRKQLFFGIVVAGLISGFWQLQAGVAVLFGVTLMLANTFYLGRCMALVSDSDIEVVQRSLYKGAAIRFAGLVVGLVLAGVLGLSLLFVGLGIFVAQAVLYFGALYDLNREQV